MTAIIRVMCVAVTLFVSAQTRAQTADPTAAPPETGIAVAEKAPSFQLLDQNGSERSLDSLLSKGNVALVFFRSADW